MSESVKVKITHHGPAATHNLLCWLCEDNPAVYSMHPGWVFKPCWKCQKEIKKPKWWQFWKP